MVVAAESSLVRTSSVRVLFLRYRLACFLASGETTMTREVRRLFLMLAIPVVFKLGGWSDWSWWWTLAPFAVLYAICAIIAIDEVIR